MEIEHLLSQTIYIFRGGKQSEIDYINYNSELSFAMMITNFFEDIYFFKTDLCNKILSPTLLFPQVVIK